MKRSISFGDDINIYGDEQNEPRSNSAEIDWYSQFSARYFNNRLANRQRQTPETADV